MEDMCEVIWTNDEYTDVEQAAESVDEFCTECGAPLELDALSDLCDDCAEKFEYDRAWL